MPRQDPPAEYRWKPGQSGNPKGRSKGATFETIVAGILDRKAPDPDYPDMTVRKKLAHMFVNEMLAGNVPLIREFLNRVWPVTHQVEARVTEPIEVQRAIPDADKIARIVAIIERSRERLAAGRARELAEGDDTPADKVYPTRSH